MQKKNERTNNMEQSLQIYQDKKFFSKISTALTKILTPTKIGINGMLISMKRTSLLKAFEGYVEAEELGDDKVKEQAENRYEDAFSLYLESIDKHVMDSVYKKVRNGIGTEFEKMALSKYYNVVHLKDLDYLEYKYKKQILLIQLDYDTVKQLNKEKLTTRFEKFYASRMETLYKRTLKNYSIKLSASNLSSKDKNELFDKIFETLEEYIVEILPIKMLEEPENAIFKDILDDYHNFESFEVGKLDQNDIIEKNMILLGISRKLFVHSLPLVVAEQCYEKLLDDARFLIMDSKASAKQDKTYGLLINLIEDYSVRLLSTKIYWDKPSARDEFKAFWDKYENIAVIKEADYIEYSKQREILFVKEELKRAYANENKYIRIIGYLKNKLVGLGAMRVLKTTAVTINQKYTKVQVKKAQEVVGE